MEQYNAALKTWREWGICSVNDLELRLDSFRVLFAYHSGKIENEDITYHDTREIFENGKVVGYTGDPRALFELQNQKVCYDFLKSRIIEKKPLSIPLILEIHRILTAGVYAERRYLINEERPGEFKKHDYVTGKNEVGSSPEDVEADLSELLEEVNAIGKQSPLKAGAYFHARFENIHPFADGNGRVGRILLNYWLMINDYPPTIIHEEDKRRYYAALQEYDEEETITPLVAFLEEQTVKTWERVMRLAEAPVQKRRGFELSIR